MGDLNELVERLNKWADVLIIPSGDFVNEDLRRTAAALTSLIAERDGLREAIATPEAVHANMLRGGIPMLSIRSALHLHGEDALEKWDRPEAAEAQLKAARELAIDDTAAAQWLRQWVKRKFGPWITWRTAWSAIKEMRAQPLSLDTNKGDGAQ